MYKQENPKRGTGGNYVYYWNGIEAVTRKSEDNIKVFKKMGEQKKDVHNLCILC